MDINAETETLVTERFAQSIAVKQQTLSTHLTEIAAACSLLTQRLAAGQKIITCGNGGSAADAQHFAAELVMRYETNRQSLPAIALTTDSSALTAISNDLDFTQIFSRQLEGLGNQGDVLVAISTSGNSANVIAAIHAAQAKGLQVLALTGNDGGDIAQLCGENDIEIRVPDAVTGRIQETHILIIHCLCEAIDHYFSEETT